MPSPWREVVCGQDNLKQPGKSCLEGLGAKATQIIVIFLTLIETYLIIYLMVPEYLTKGKAEGIYVYFADNGVFAHLYKADFKQNEYHVFTSYSSYPFNEYVKPAWQQGDDFWLEFTERLNTDFNGSYFVKGIPTEELDDFSLIGKTPQRIMFKPGMFDSLKSKLKNVTPEELVTKFRSHFLEGFNTKVVFLVLDFDKIILTEFTPYSLANGTEWEYKQSILDTKDWIVSVMESRYSAFLSTSISLRDRNNLIINTAFFRPATTSSGAVLDIYRAIYTSFLLEIAKRSELTATSSGVVVVTGEVVSFMTYASDLLLTIIDGLQLKGLWSIHVDPVNSIIPLMFHAEDKTAVPLSPLMPSGVAYYSPGILEQTTVLYADENKFLAPAGNLVSFSLDKKSSHLVVPDRVDLLLPESKITGVVLDTRPRPLEYGPTYHDNMVKVKGWLSKLSNLFNV